MSQTSEPAQRTTASMASARDYAVVTVFMLLWLLPILWKGLTRRDVPGMPAALRDMHNVACLFTHRVNTWYRHYVGVRFEGSSSWYPVPMDELSRHNPFGYRTRIERYLEGDPLSPDDKLRYRHLSWWVRKRQEELHPERGRVTGVRLYRAFFATGDEALANPAGRWERLPPDAVDPESVGVMWTESFDAPEPRR